MILCVTLSPEIPTLHEENAGRYRDIVENASDLIFTVDLDDRITSVNAAFERALGRSRDDLLGRPLSSVVVPYGRSGVLGGVMLGLGRALGETMAVTFVIGNAHRISASILAPGTTISATIANEFTEAVGDLYTSSLIALGFILFVITFIVLAIARYMLSRLELKIR